MISSNNCQKNLISQEILGRSCPTSIRRNFGFTNWNFRSNVILITILTNGGLKCNVYVYLLKKVEFYVYAGCKWNEALFMLIGKKIKHNSQPLQIFIVYIRCPWQQHSRLKNSNKITNCNTLPKSGIVTQWILRRHISIPHNMHLRNTELMLI